LFFFSCVADDGEFPLLVVIYLFFSLSVTNDNKPFLVIFIGVENNDEPRLVIISWVFSSNGKDDDKLGGS
jgi:hypothetical protein